MNFNGWEWSLAILGALLVGVSKTGVAGLGMLFVVIFTYIMPAKQATGVVLPLLCFGDLIAVISYRQHANWRHVWGLFPWAGAGVVLGAVALGRVDDHQAKLMIGWIVLVLLVLHLVRRRYKKVDDTDHGWWFAPTIGLLAGFTTLVANAAGPLMAIYLLAMRLPKMEFVGTSAVFFMMLNLYKIPFMIYLGLITTASFTVNLALAPAVFLGAFLGRKLLVKIDQKLFENLALGLAAVAGLRLLF